MDPEKQVINQLKKGSVDYILTLPCDRVKTLLSLIPGNFKEIQLSREEEGVGICAGLAMTGKKPAMLIQSSGIGNMVNAICSLTKVYKLPLPIIMSWRGVYKENIVAQIPLGKYLTRLLGVLEVQQYIIDEASKIIQIGKAINDTYNNNDISAILLSPRLWEGSTQCVKTIKLTKKDTDLHSRCFPQNRSSETTSRYKLKTRYELLCGLVPYLRGRIVVSNIGITSRELYSIFDQDTNFYMLGSFGMASAVGLGIAIGSRKDTVVLDGDGSILTNPGTLSTIAQQNPPNLSIVCIDNGVHGATGNQPTATSGKINLEDVAVSFGIERTYKCLRGKDIGNALKTGKGTLFIHAPAAVGNKKVPEIPLSPIQIKTRIMRHLTKT